MLKDSELMVQFDFFVLVLLECLKFISNVYILSVLALSFSKLHNLLNFNFLSCVIKKIIKPISQDCCRTPNNMCRNALYC